MTSIDPWRVRVDLIVIELDLVATFLRVARTSPKAESRMRNQVYAREAYQMACRYRSQLQPRAEVDRVLQALFTDAEFELKAAGPEFDR